MQDVSNLTGSALRVQIQDARSGAIPHMQLKKSDVAMLHDIEHHVVIVEAAVFTGMLVSTCFLQLWVIGSPVAFLLTAAIHQDFWITVWNVKGGAAFLSAMIVVLIMKWCTTLCLGKVPTDGHSIKRPIMWLVCFVGFSTVWLLLGFFLALLRFVVLVLASVLSFGRLDRNVFKFANRIDQGYGAYLALTTMDDTIDVYLETAANVGDEKAAETAEAGGAKLSSPVCELACPPVAVVADKMEAQ